MIRFSPIVLMLMLSACGSTSPNVVSSIAYLPQPVDTQCAFEAVRDADGFSVVGRPQPRGTADAIDAQFNQDLPVQILIRNLPDGTGEASTFVRLPTDADPLDRRAAEFAVRSADRAIYASCTEDGQTYDQRDTITLETTEKE